MASAALKVSISALASSISALMPVWMVWGIVLSSCAVIPGRREASNPESRSIHFQLHRDSGFALRAPRNDDDGIYRTSSFIAPSRPSIVIGYMRSENSRRMMVVDSE